MDNPAIVTPLLSRSIGPRVGQNRREFLGNVGRSALGLTAAANLVPSSNGDTFATREAHAAEARIPVKRIDGSTWEAGSIDLDDYLGSVILNASKAGVLKSKNDFKKLDPAANQSEIDSQFENYVSEWKQKARKLEKPGNLSSFFYGVFILKGKGNEKSRIISDDQAEALLTFSDILKSSQVVNELYGYITSGFDPSVIKQKAGEKIVTLLNSRPQLANK